MFALAAPHPPRPSRWCSEDGHLLSVELLCQIKCEIGLQVNGSWLRNPHFCYECWIFCRDGSLRRSEGRLKGPWGPLAVFLITCWSGCFSFGSDEPEWMTAGFNYRAVNARVLTSAECRLKDTCSRLKPAPVAQRRESEVDLFRWSHLILPATPRLSDRNDGEKNHFNRVQTSRAKVRKPRKDHMNMYMIENILLFRRQTF